MSSVRALAAVVAVLVLAPLAAAQTDSWGFRTTADSKARKIRVTSVTKDGIADRIGLRKGDVLVKVNGQEITDHRSLDSALQSAAGALTNGGPGRELTMEWDRGKERKKGSVMLTRPRLGSGIKLMRKP